jgi:hypothetical protein
MDGFAAGRPDGTHAGAHYAEPAEAYRSGGYGHAAPGGVGDPHPSDWLGQADPSKHAQLQEFCARRHSYHGGWAGQQRDRICGLATGIDRHRQNVAGGLGLRACRGSRRFRAARSAAHGLEPGGLPACTHFLLRHAAESVSGRLQPSSLAAAGRKPHLPPHAAPAMAAGL